MLEGIKSVLGTPRIVIILSDPVDRLWSAYTFQRTKGHLSGVGSFEEYVAVCNDKRRLGQRQGPYFGGVTISFYGDYIPDWFDLFGDDVRIMFADFLFEDPRAEMEGLSRWLGIDDQIAGSFDYSTHNKTAQPGTSPSAEPPSGSGRPVTGSSSECPELAGRCEICIFE
jgi:Sulfotransferase domain